MITDETYDVIGVMSGTSVDGLDLAYCRFLRKEKQWQYFILETQSIPYDSHWQNILLNILSSSGEDIFYLDIEFGEYIGDQVNNFIRKINLRPHLIASHGHTVFHQPGKAISVQIGNGQSINRVTGITTVNDFRALDVQLGGQGAPLVPIGDLLLFKEYKYCLNLGGFSNVSLDVLDQRIAYDICPVNIILNHLARKTGVSFDDRGKIAREGELDSKLLDELNSLDHYNKPHPKSLGLEWVNQNILPLFENGISIPDALCTFTHHIGIQVNRSLHNHSVQGDSDHRVLVTGGGAYNDFLMEILNRYNSGDLIFISPDKILVDFKEALIFALIGVLRMRREVNTLSSVTGASRDSCGGIIHENCSITLP